MEGTSTGLSASDVAMLNNRGGMGFDGDAFWIFALLILAGGGFGGWGDNRGYQPQYATQDFVQNGFNFNDLQSQNRDILNAINSGAAQSVAATNQAKYDQINVAKDLSAQLQNSIANVAMVAQQNQANQQQCCCNILRGIDGINYNGALNTASINATTTAQTQKILDALATDKIEGLQNQVNQLQLQNAVAGVVRYPNASTYYAGVNPFCNTGCCTA